jgi:DNA-binding transcriptional regulator WhiA
MQKNQLKHPVELIHQCGEYYTQGHSIKETAQQFNVSYEWVKQNLLRYGYRTPSKKLPHQLHEPITYFSNIDTHNKAYLLGWLFSDGYVCRNPYGYTLGIALQASDKYILDFMAAELNLPESKVRPYKNSYKLCVNEKTVCEDLIRLGVIENKSHTDIHVPSIPEEFLSSFIAGVFDGDGCITKKQGKYFSVSICSNSKIYLEEIKNILQKYDINITDIAKEKENIHVLRISSKNKGHVKFANYIYANREIKLIRKYNKFMEIPR